MGKRGLAVIDINDGEMDEWWCNWYSCDSCSNRSIAEHFKFCPHCGIKLDWSQYDIELAKRKAHTIEIIKDKLTETKRRNEIDIEAIDPESADFTKFNTEKL